MAKILAFDGKQTDTPDNILRKVPGRPKNSDVRTREYLSLEEVEALMKAAGNTGRHPHRDRSSASRSTAALGIDDGARVPDGAGNGRRVGRLHAASW